MDCKSRQNLGLRLLIYSFMVLPLSSLCIQIWSILLQYQKVRGGSSVKLFALEGDSSYFNPKFSFQNVIPIFSNTIILLMTLKSILPTLRLLKRIWWVFSPLYGSAQVFSFCELLVLSFFSVFQHQLPVWDNLPNTRLM